MNLPEIPNKYQIHIPSCLRGKMKLSRREDGLFSLELTFEEISGMFKTTDERLQDDVPLYAIEHKFWEVARAILVDGKQETSIDKLLWHKGDDASQVAGD